MNQAGGADKRTSGDRSGMDEAIPSPTLPRGTGASQGRGYEDYKNPLNMDLMNLYVCAYYSLLCFD